jgi:hypothetical protein
MGEEESIVRHIGTPSRRDSVRDGLIAIRKWGRGLELRSNLDQVTRIGEESADR